MSFNPHTGLGKPIRLPLDSSAEAAALHERLLDSPDYAALASHVDARLEALLAQLERGGHTLEVFEGYAGELRGLRASRGASTVTRGRRA